MRTSSPVTARWADVNFWNIHSANNSNAGGPAGQQGHPASVDPPAWRQHASVEGQVTIAGLQRGALQSPLPHWKQSGLPLRYQAQ